MWSIVILMAFAVVGLVAPDPARRGRRAATVLTIVTVVYVALSQGLV